MTIVCTRPSDFIHVIEGLVKKGLTFEADYDMLTITLTGGY